MAAKKTTAKKEEEVVEETPVEETPVEEVAPEVEAVEPEPVEEPVVEEPVEEPVAVDDGVDASLPGVYQSQINSAEQIISDLKDQIKYWEDHIKELKSK